MTPQERQLIDDLFDRLARLEGTPRDPEAMSAIMQGLRQAPNAVYALVQTALVQDEALKRANNRIQELEAGQRRRTESIRRLPRFDARRDFRAEPAARLGAARLGAERPRPRRGRPPGMEQRRGDAADPGRTTRRRPVWSGARLRSARLRPALRRAAGAVGGGGGGSFLGTAAAAAAGVVGGSLLLGSIRSMMGGEPSAGLRRYRRPSGQHRRSAAGGRSIRQRPGAGRRHQRHRLIRKFAHGAVRQQ